MPSLSRYEILSPIGDNHFARYYKGYDTVGERDVCIIEFLEKFRKNLERWDLIWQQILSAGRVKHDYMVSVYDYDRERGWVVTELMLGSLRDLPPEALSNIELVRTVLYRTLETLDYLHSQNHPHGDVRPANLLYDVAGQTRLSYSPGVALGGQIPRRERDHAFLAPEMFDSSFGDVGIGVDLYGCGMSALSLLLGADFSKKLLGVAVSDDVAWQRFHRDLNSHPSVRALVPNIPSDMERVIQKLISKKVDQRFTSIAEARALLVRPEVEVKIQVRDIKPQEEKKRPSSLPLQLMEPAVSRPKPAARPQENYPPFSREWINLKLKNPLVMGGVCGGILLLMLLAMAFVSSLKKPVLVRVLVHTKPTGATIFIDDKQHSAPTDSELMLAKGPQELRLELAGYEVHKSKFEVPGDKGTFDLPVIELVKIPEKSAVDPKPVEPVVPVASWKLPAGLEPIGTEIDSTTQLPRRVVAIRLKPDLQEKDVPLSFVLMTPGKYAFGATEPLEEGELLSQPYEITNPFYLAEYELTEAQQRPYLKSLSTAGTLPPLEDDRRNYPVVGIPYSQAIEYCKWLGGDFDLPSEQEWEYGVRGIAGRTYPWGNDPPAQDLVRMKAFVQPGVATTVRVDELPRGATPEGLHHLLGNAAEWCRDLYAPGHNETTETTGSGSLHVIRGGSYRSPGSGSVRVSWRANAPESGANDVGVRILCHPVSTKSP